jgi:hypothetical protein
MIKGTAKRGERGKREVPKSTKNTRAESTNYFLKFWLFLSRFSLPMLHPIGEVRIELKV